MGLDWLNDDDRPFKAHETRPTRRARERRGRQAGYGVLLLAVSLMVKGCLTATHVPPPSSRQPSTRTSIPIYVDPDSVDPELYDELERIWATQTVPETTTTASTSSTSSTVPKVRDQPLD